MISPINIVSLYSELKKQFERDEECFLLLQKEWEKLKSEGISEDKLEEVKGCEFYNYDKESVRSLYQILSHYLVDVTFKETSPYLH